MGARSDLNKLMVLDKFDQPVYSLADYGTSTPNGMVTAYFKDLADRLVEHIGQADIVVGCVAWFTSAPILDALAKIKGVSIVVQKEDWLRPDSGASTGWKSKLREQYAKLPCTVSRYDSALIGTPLHLLSAGSNYTVEPVRCVGNANTARAPASPRSHHKFVVFCKEKTELVVDGDMRGVDSVICPYSVWTGSFNFTRNAGLSFENAVVINEQAIVNAYFKEWAQITALSELLEWESEWSVPQWRVGT